MSSSARPCRFVARAGGVFLGALMLSLSACSGINTDNLTAENFIGFFLRTLCRSQNNCDVREPM